MKKSLLALAVLGAFAGTAAAQSSVTLYGTLDLSGKYVKNDGSVRRLSLSQDGLNSSQLGFRGIEDLGGGIKAGFNIIAALAPEVGGTTVTTTPNNAGALINPVSPTGAALSPAPGVTSADSQNNRVQTFNRRATVSLFSNAGELRLGRDYVPTFWNMTLFGVDGTNGLGNTLNVRQLYNGTRFDNAVQYFLPSNLGGLYGQLTAAAEEGGTTLDRPARYLGGRVGFAAGPFDVAVAFSQERFSNSFGYLVGAAVTGNNGFQAYLPPGTVAHQNTVNAGGTYDFGFLKLFGYYDHEKLVNFSENMYSAGTVIPFGQSEVHLSYNRSNANIGTFATSATGAVSLVSNSIYGPTSKSTVQQFAATYQYNLSKRSAMYGTIAFLRNDNNSRFNIAASSTSSFSALPTAGGDSRGFELGVRHFF